MNPPPAYVPERGIRTATTFTLQVTQFHTSYTSESRSEQQLIERLQKGERCNFSGALIQHLFLEEIGFEEIMSVFPRHPGATYQSQDIMGVLFHSINLGIPSIESLI